MVKIAIKVSFKLYEVDIMTFFQASKIKKRQRYTPSLGLNINLLYPSAFVRAFNSITKNTINKNMHLL